MVKSVSNLSKNWSDRCSSSSWYRRWPKRKRIITVKIPFFPFLAYVFWKRRQTCTDADWLFLVHEKRRWYSWLSREESIWWSKNKLPCRCGQWSWIWPVIAIFSSRMIRDNCFTQTRSNLSHSKKCSRGISSLFTCYTFSFDSIFLLVQCVLHILCFSLCCIVELFLLLLFAAENRLRQVAIINTRKIIIGTGHRSCLMMSADRHR